VNILSSNWRRGRIARYAPLFLWIGVIFFLSSSFGAASNTSRFIRPLLEWLFPNALPETLTIYHGYIRKFAHFAEYAILAFWASRAFRSSLRKFLQNNWVVFSLALVVLTALIDELNQSFNSQRTGAIYDVALDCFGGVFMILIVVAIGRYKGRNPRVSKGA
jgi:VanZ family protein